MKVIAWVALVASLIGSMLAMSAYWRVRSVAPSTGSPDVDDLKARVARLERELASAPRQAGESDPPPVSSESPPADVAELRKRIESLEQRQTAGRFTPPESGRMNRPNPELAEIYKKRLFDTSQKDQLRAQSLYALRTQGAHKADDVVDAGLALLAQSKEPPARTLVLRALQGADNPRIVQPVLTILATDSNDTMRYEAAGTLGDYVEQPAVKAALEAAAANDASERVRRRAQAALTAHPAK